MLDLNQVKKQLNLLSSSVLFLSLLLQACTKDKTPALIDNGSNVNNDIECTDIVFSGSDIFDNWINTGYQYTNPTFSPFSDNEFIFIRSGPNSEKQLIKYNIQTESEQILCTNTDISNGVLYQQADWGNQNWIVFSVGTGASGICYKISGNGTGLEQITPGTISATSPHFNSQGDRFIISGSVLGSGINSYRPILNLFGAKEDSIPVYFGSKVIGAPYFFDDDFFNGLFAFTDQSQSPLSNGVGVSSTGSFDSLFSINNYGETLLNIGQYGNEIYFLINRVGLFSYNVSSGNISLIQEICDSRHIRSFSISKNSGNILIEEVKRTKVDEFGGVDEQSNIYLLNPTNGVKTEILVE